MTFTRLHRTQISEGKGRFSNIINPGSGSVPSPSPPEERSFCPSVPGPFQGHRVRESHHLPQAYLGCCHTESSLHWARERRLSVTRVPGPSRPPRRASFCTYICSHVIHLLSHHTSALTSVADSGTGTTEQRLQGARGK